MKYLFKLIILFNVLFFTSCAHHGNIHLKMPGNIIVTGKILHFHNNNTLKIEVNKLACEIKTIMPAVDSLGNFSFTFSSYIPSDIYIIYGGNFYAITHPGDSLHIVFDGDKKDFLKTIKFSGSASKSNQDLAAFQEMYFTNSLNTDYSLQIKAIKEYNSEKYLAFCDSVRIVKNKIYQKFLKRYLPNKETKNWISTFLKNDYYYSIAWYPPLHNQLNNLNPHQLNIPISYYNKINEMLPIKKSMLISTTAINSFINYYYFMYVFNNAKKNYNKNLSDSLLVSVIIKLVPNGLTRQLVLTNMFEQDLNVMRINYFENHEDEIDKLITEPYLKQPLFKLYDKEEDALENPQIASGATLKNFKNLSVKQIMDSVLSINRGKVIYLDCWATWCGPCIAEMPNSIELMKELKNKNVAFVFICIDSKIKDWKATIDRFQLTGQHYFLNKMQSSEFRKSYGVVGIPDYFLINKRSKIIEKGFKLLPYTVKGKIESLLQ